MTQKNKKFRKSFLTTVVLFILIFFNNWFLTIFSGKEYFKSLVLIFIALLLRFSGKFNKIKYLILLIPFLTIYFNKGVSENIFELSQEEIFFINTRRSYYESKFSGKIFENKPLRFLYNYQKNLFQGIDLNYYFFGNHPRERVGIKEINKFSFLFLPFFLYGLFLNIKDKNVLVFLYFFVSLFLASLFKQIDTFSFLFFPFIVLNIYFGVREILSRMIFNK